MGGNEGFGAMGKRGENSDGAEGKRSNLAVFQLILCIILLLRTFKMFIGK